jgi:hypothetical protein
MTPQRRCLLETVSAYTVRFERPFVAEASDGDDVEVQVLGRIAAN